MCNLLHSRGHTKRRHPQVWPQMRTAVQELFGMALPKMNPRRLQYCFELLGLDFMIDEQGQVCVCVCASVCACVCECVCVCEYVITLETARTCTLARACICTSCIRSYTHALVHTHTLAHKHALGHMYVRNVLLPPLPPLPAPPPRCPWPLRNKWARCPPLMRWLVGWMTLELPTWARTL